MAVAWCGGAGGLKSVRAIQPGGSQLDSQVVGGGRLLLWPSGRFVLEV